MRTYETKRKTAETDITLFLNLDGTGKSSIDTGCGFLNHMLTLFAAHGKFDLTVKCVGDNDVDDHHSVEDIGIVLGQAFQAALGDKRGITRYGSFLLPMDEALILTAVVLILNFLSATGGEFVGNVLHYLLVIVSSPMICSGYWALSLFLWACLLTLSRKVLKKK